MRYAIIIEKATGNYSAYSPDVPGCTATGATLEKVKQQIQERWRSILAIQQQPLLLNGHCEDG